MVVRSQGPSPSTDHERNRIMDEDETTCSVCGELALCYDCGECLYGGCDCLDWDDDDLAEDET